MNLELNGKVALVTAASQGIGRAVATTLASEGALVAANSRRPEALAVGTFANRIFPYPADLGDPGQYGNLVEQVVRDHGRLDIAVLNTPGPRILPLMDVQDADWESAFNQLVRPCLRLAQDAARQMVQQGGGSIVFLTSTWVRQTMPGGALSAVMRSALSALSKQMALELATAGVRVNQVLPGATATARMQHILESKALKNHTDTDTELRQVVAQIPMGRWGQPQEIADAVAFVVSPRSAFMTGATLQVDGGAIRSTL